LNDAYKEAGVDIQAGEAAVRGIKSLVRKTFTPQVLTDLGSFGGCFAFPADKYKNPVLVASTDGVGTKLVVANLMDRFDSIGQCLVNHCVNDILTTGARPLFFLDYVGFGKMDPRKIHSIIAGLALACEENGCALIGGEMAEMPGIYREKDFDLVGTIVGVVERELILHDRVRSGDVLLGLSSSGLHTNGYSLARKVLLSKFQVNDRLPELKNLLGDELLKVHRSYLKPVAPLLGAPGLHAISHITGGGIVGNTKRIIPEDLRLEIDWKAWKWPPIFKLIQSVGQIDESEMRKVFNLGVGLVLIVEKLAADGIKRQLEQNGESAVYLGHIE